MTTTQSAVTLTFTDVGDEVEVTCSCPVGFDKTSKAHQMANMVMNYLDSVAEVKHGEAVNAAQ